MTEAAEEAIADFAAHLVPEAFSTPTTAYRVEVIERGTRPGSFTQWVEQCRHDAVAAAYPFGGTPTGMVFVQWGDTRWRWDQEPCCELQWLTDRVRDEIAAFPEPWVFVCSLRLRDAAMEGDDTEATRVTWTLPWYAEARSRHVARVFAAAYRMCGTEVVGTARVTEPTPFVRAARRVLLRHPSRREHPLTRR